jgi:cytochrome c
MTKTMMLILAGIAVGGVAQASEDLAKAKNCLTCHAADKKIVGPSYKDIAAKRAGEKGAEAALAQKIKAGSKNEWGTVPMPPNNVSDAEAAALAKWVLAHK